jgi:hypothetical protein
MLGVNGGQKRGGGMAYIMMLRRHIIGRTSENNGEDFFSQDTNPSIGFQSCSEIQTMQDSDVMLGISQCCAGMVTHSYILSVLFLGYVLYEWYTVK